MARKPHKRPQTTAKSPRPAHKSKTVQDQINQAVRDSRRRAAAGLKKRRAGMTITDVSGLSEYKSKAKKRKKK